MLKYYFLHCFCLSRKTDAKCVCHVKHFLISVETSASTVDNTDLCVASNKVKAGICQGANGKTTSNGLINFWGSNQQDWSHGHMVTCQSTDRHVLWMVPPWMALIFYKIP